MWRTSKLVPRSVPTVTRSLITPMRGAGPVMVREGNTLMMRSAPVVDPVAPTVVSAGQVQALLDLDFDVSGLTRR